MKDVMSPGDITVRPAIPLEMRVVIALYKLGGCGEFRAIAYCFGVHKTTVMKYVYMLCKGMLNQAIRHFIKVPSLQEACATAERYESNFCIPQHTHTIGGTPVNLIVLGDAAYPLLEWFLKAYISRPTLTPEQNSFYICLSDATAATGIAFHEVESKMAGSTIPFHLYVAITCCALQNFCEREEESFSQAWMEEAAALERSVLQPTTQSYTHLNKAGQAVRQVLTEYMASNFPLQMQDQ